ncbi:MAG TPA: ubiquitin-like small modifier protein 1 [Terriglobia bacterium]|jgi:MoaD family protein|nr:ubiquitin-like small modifier protein 1 [Terriglobia bacterium]
MTITFYIPGPLRQYTEGRSQVEINVSAANVAEALAALWQAYPGLRDRVLTEQGEVRQHVNIFVAEENIRDHGGLAAVVKNGAVVTIVPAVSGG